MILSCILLAISVSIDALSLGIVYGIKKKYLKFVILLFLQLLLYPQALQ